MSSKRPKTPQEKKALSLEKDRGGYFFNNQKAARKAVPLRKALESRRTRHENNQALSQVERVPQEIADLVESSNRHNSARKGGWRKGTSEPLGAVIKRALENRAARVSRKLRSRVRSDGS